MSFLLLNDGSSALLLNDGSSKLLLNGEPESAGITISGQHSGIYTNKSVKLVKVRFTFHLLAGIIPLKLFSEGTFSKLAPYSFDSKMLREAFVLPIAKLQFKLKSIRKKLQKEYELETFGNLLSMATESDLIKTIGSLFRK